jgi:endonuclease G
MRAIILVGLPLLLFAGTAADASPPPAPASKTPGNLPKDYSKCEAVYAAIGLPRMKTDGSKLGPAALCRMGYAVAFNPMTHTPDWVIERITARQLQGKAQRKDNFTADKDVPTITAYPGDYDASNYDRGHQAPAGDFKSSQPMTDQSFLMTNMAPQVGAGFNRNIWKQLETDVRSWVLCGRDDELYVVTGPVFGDKDKSIAKGKNGPIRVPSYFFKVIYDPANNRALGMMLPNEKLKTADLPKYAVAISDIEEQTGIVFFPALSVRRQNILKSSVGNLWGTNHSCTKDVGD